jgi:polysaccharide export outer membrane protein
MLKMKLILLTGLLFIFNGCANKSDYRLLQTDKNVTEQGVKVTDRSIEYRILPQDRLEIALYKDPQQGATVQGALGQSMSPNGLLVNTSGYVPLPLIGKVKVAGLTQTQAADRIKAQYKKYLNTPSVYVEVLNKRVFILGEVKSPGVVEIDKEKMTLFEALANAGDFTDDAVRNDIMILSNCQTKGMQMRRVDLTNFDTMNYASLMLRPNDIVYVQPDDWKEFKVASDNYTAPFETITKLASPFVTLKYLSD